ncbi:uncharacterized protein GBIM_04709 [Gryllus bimaculatus]|nr:uncharacterized protein GBIM_04709 [Gryllus bimaculatus]
MPTVFLPLQSGGDSAATSPDTGEPPPPGAASKGAGDTDGDARCGWCLFRPGLLQRFRTAKWVLFWLCWAGTMQDDTEKESSAFKDVLLQLA